jgi:hypothetical protein
MSRATYDPELHWSGQFQRASLFSSRYARETVTMLTEHRQPDYIDHTYDKYAHRIFASHTAWLVGEKSFRGVFGIRRKMDISGQ